MTAFSESGQSGWVINAASISVAQYLIDDARTERGRAGAAIVLKAAVRLTGYRRGAPDPKRSLAYMWVKGLECRHHIVLLRRVRLDINNCEGRTNLVENSFRFCLLDQETLRRLG